VTRLSRNSNSITGYFALKVQLLPSSVYIWCSCKSGVRFSAPLLIQYYKSCSYFRLHRKWSLCRTSTE